MFSKSKNQPLTLPMSIGKLGKGLDMSRHLHLNFHVTLQPSRSDCSEVSPLAATHFLEN